MQNNGLPAKMRTPQLNGIVDGTGKWNKSSYVKIDSSHYRNFSGFVDDEIEAKRAIGFQFQQVYNHILKQVKGTIDNDKSSRSILVYDFQIEFATPVVPIIYTYVPFVIYDLPGKEDLFKTYVKFNPNGVANTARKQFAFDDIPNDDKVNGEEIKERKSSYVLNPLRIPSFDDNIDTIISVLTDTSPDGPDNKIEPSFLKNIIQDMLNTPFKTNEIKGSTTVTITEVTKVFGDLFSFPGTISNFGQLFDEANLNDAIVKNQDTMADDYGFSEIARINDSSQYPRVVHQNLAIMVIRILLKYNLYDIIVEIINKIVGNSTWTVEKIYAFFEAYYINENVVGLLQYLIKDILEENKPSAKEVFERQKSEPAIDTVGKIIKDNNYYRMFYVDRNDPGNLSYSMPIKLDLELFNPISDDENVDGIRILLDKFLIKTSGSDKGEFALADGRNNKQVFDAMRLYMMRENQGSYNSNKIFRNGKKSNNTVQIVNPKTTSLESVTNRPLLQDFLEPYRKKISFYYVFYVVTNNAKELKGEEQIKLLNNSMPFIDELGTTDKKSSCNIE